LVYSKNSIIIRFSCLNIWISESKIVETVEKFNIQNLEELQEKIEICNNSFAFEQVYMTKDRKECFFESHKKYIDIQFVLDGEEQIEVENISNLEVYKRYDPEIDLIKYKHKDFVSKIILKNGEGIVLFPEDGHMPSVKVNETSKVLKVVIKLEV
jgi:YhcH/YjgK/YiaL family protein